jgi:hypothetical protein
VSKDFLKKSEQGLLTAEVYKQIVRKFELKVMQEQNAEKLKNDLQEQIKARLDEDSFKSFVHSGISFEKDYFEYAGQKVGFLDGKNIVEFYSDMSNKFESDVIDFNELTLDFIRHYYNSDSSLILGSIRVDIRSKESSNSAKLSYVNDTRINNSEVKEVIEKAICFEEQKDYDKFLEGVSRCSLRFHEYIANGVVFDMSDYGKTGYNNSKDNKRVRLNMRNKGGKNLLYYKKDNVEFEFKMKDTNKVLASLAEMNNRYRHGGVKRVDFGTVVEVLSAFVPEENLFDMLREGVKEHELVLKRSEELLANAVKTLGAKKMTLSKYGDGYLVQGSLATYFVPVSDSKKVYKYPEMSYICIVEKSAFQRVNNDLLVNRLYALKNDSVLIKEISTLNAVA